MKRLREGKAVLVVWRGSTPHNTFVESRNGRTSHLWHSDGWEKPNMQMFQLVSESVDQINHSWVHSDGGKPFQSTYELKPEFRLPEAG